MLRKLILGTSSWALLAVAASAADLPALTKVPPATAQSWAGFYLGVHGGYGWGRNDISVRVAVDNHISPINSAGAVYGGHAGYNWQFGRAVVGVEIDFSATGISGSVSRSGFVPNQFTFDHTRTDRVKYLGTARGRLGWSATDNLLIFGTAGVGAVRDVVRPAERERRQCVSERNAERDDPVRRLRLGGGCGC